jgi:hypothetical protein
VVSPGRDGGWGLTDRAFGGHFRAVRTDLAAVPGRLALALPLVLLAASLTGCLREPEVAWVAEAPLPPPEPLIERQLTVSPDEAPAPGTGAAPLVTRAPAPDPIPFEIGAGYGALAQVDLARCAERGLPPGYLHLRATFTADGYVVGASVSSPTAPPPAALDCIAEQLRLIGVPAFDGAHARLSKTYFVSGAAPRGETVM